MTDGPIITIADEPPEIVVPRMRSDAPELERKRQQWEAEQKLKAEQDAIEALTEIGRLPAREELGKLAYMALGMALQKVITGQVPIKTPQQVAAIVNAAGTLLRHEEERNGSVDIGDADSRREEVQDLMERVRIRREALAIEA